MTSPSTPTDISVSGSQVSFINTDTSVTNYAYSLNSGMNWANISPSQTVSPLDFSFLPGGMYAGILIRAINNEGFSNSVYANNVMVSKPPATPTVISVSGPYVYYSNNDIFNDQHQYSTDNGTTWEDFNPQQITSPLNFSFLSVGTYSCIMIRSVNSVGYSDPANASNVIITVPPSSPLVLSVSNQYINILNNDTSVVNYQFNTGGMWYDIVPAQTTTPLDFSFLPTGLYTSQLRIRSVNSVGATSSAVIITDQMSIQHPGLPTLTASGTAVTAFSNWYNLSQYQWSTNASTQSYNSVGIFLVQASATWTTIAAATGAACTFIPTGLVSGNNIIYVRGIVQGIPGRVSSITINYSPIMTSIMQGGTHVVAAASTAHSVTAYNGATLVAGEFKTNTTLHTVDLSATTISSIPPLTFKGCTALTQVNLPPLANTIEAASFEGCSALSAITIPPSVNNIGIQSFSGSGLTSVTLTGPVTIGAHAFALCTSMTTASI